MIEDELCTCGHLKSEHHDAVGGLAKGHGSCSHKMCPCPKFTWQKTIKREKNDLDNYR